MFDPADVALQLGKRCSRYYRPTRTEDLRTVQAVNADERPRRHALGARGERRCEADLSIQSALGADERPGIS